MKNKFSQLLDDYCDNLKRLGIYLLIVLFVFVLAVNVMFNRDKMVEKAMKDLTPIEITTEPSATKAPEESSSEHTPTQGEEVAQISITSGEEIVTDDTTENRENTTLNEENVEGDSKPLVSEQVDNSRPLTNSSTRQLSLVWPLKGEILTGYELKYSSTYGDYRLHSGLDIKGEPGSIVKAAASGKVILVEKSSAEGVIIQIEHENGYTTTYAHLEEALVEKGQAVSQGDTIGTIGQPGTTEEDLGPHLHFEIKQNEKTLNPLEILEKA